MQIVTNHMQTIPHNKILNRTPPEISNTEQALPHYTRRLLAQLTRNCPNTELPPMSLTNT